MDIEEFAKQVQPRKKRSRLIPFRDQIMTLKEQGYTDLQIRDWLTKNDVTVSREMVRKFVAQQFLEKRIESPLQGTPNENETRGTTQESTAPVNPACKAVMTQADKMRKKVEDQKRQAETKLFKHDKTGNNNSGK